MTEHQPQDDLADAIDEGAVDIPIYKNRNFMLLWGAQAISQTAQNAIWLGLMVVVEETTRSSTQMGVAILTTILPSILLGMVAGVIVDHLTKKRVLVLTNLLRAVVVLGYLFYPIALYVAYAVNFISSTITQFFAPAEAAKIPQLVGKRSLIHANSLFNLTFNGSQLAGMVIIGPPMVKLFGPSSIFIGASAAFAIAALLVSFLPPEEPPAQSLFGLKARQVSRQVWDDVLEGWRFITADRFTTLAMIHLTLSSALMLIVAMIAARFVVAVLGMQAEDSVFILAPAGVGILIGTLFMGKLAARVPKHRIVTVALLLMSGLIVLLSTVGHVMSLNILPSFLLPGLSTASSGVVPVMIIALFLGSTIAAIIIPSQTTLMERAPTASRGRIFAVQIVLGHVASIAPLIFIGGLADLIGINLVITMLGVSVLLVWFISTDTFARRRTARGSRSDTPADTEAEPVPVAEAAAATSAVFTPPVPVIEPETATVAAEDDGGADPPAQAIPQPLPGGPADSAEALEDDLAAQAAGRAAAAAQAAEPGAREPSATELAPSPAPLPEDPPAPDPPPQAGEEAETGDAAPADDSPAGRQN